ncbi:DUF551 domain-containing protein [Tardiphaga sp. 367_B4_N1_1]|uniref:DUF551 domain-containing protein n=1 Tax=Tardiphaga sp. 367_B4_N1_1 TaxID=3240777 RepID=UPI003F29B875
MSEWKPIATAPRDGTRLLIFDGQAYIARWRDDACFGGNDENRPAWQIFDCEGDEWYAVATDEATHWMPLPAAPAVLE